MKTALQYVQDQLSGHGCSYGIQTSYTLGTQAGAPICHILNVFGPKYEGQRYSAGQLLIIDWREDATVAWLLEPRETLSIGFQAVERANGPREHAEKIARDREIARQLDFDLPGRPF